MEAQLRIPTVCCWASPRPSLILTLGLWRDWEVWLEGEVMRITVDGLTQIHPLF